MNHRPTAAQRRHWDRVAALGCIVTGRQAHLAHCAGKPSVVARIQEPKAKGVKLRRLHWLVLPLAPELHYLLDYDPEAFERQHGPVAGLLDKLAARLGVDVWRLSQEGRK